MHERPHAPQWLSSVRRLTQRPAHTTSPGRHLGAQTPAVQISVGPHVVPHAPQLVLSLVRLRQMPPQLVVPARQLTRHIPA